LIVETNRSEGAVWFWCLAVGFNDRYCEMSCNAATGVLQMRGFFGLTIAASAKGWIVLCGWRLLCKEKML